MTGEDHSNYIQLYNKSVLVYPAQTKKQLHKNQQEFEKRHENLEYLRDAAGNFMKNQLYSQLAIYIIIIEVTQFIGKRITIVTVISIGNLEADAALLQKTANQMNTSKRWNRMKVKFTLYFIINYKFAVYIMYYIFHIRHIIYLCSSGLSCLLYSQWL